MGGKRKFRAFLVTISLNTVLCIAAFMYGVTLSGSDLTTILALNSAVSAAFFGANWGEHAAAAKAAVNGGKS